MPFRERTADEIAVGLTDTTQCTAKSRRRAEAAAEAGDPSHQVKGHICDSCRCRGPAMDGQAVCRMHGGMNKAARANGKKRLAEVEVRKELRRRGLGHAVDTTPAEALQRAIELARGNVEALAEMVRETAAVADPEVDDEPVTAHPAYEHYRAAINDLARMAKLGHDAGIAERKQDLQEAQARLVGVALRRILERLHLSEHQWSMVPAVARDVLGALSPSGTDVVDHVMLDEEVLDAEVVE